METVTAKDKKGQNNMDAVEFLKAYRRICANFASGRPNDCYGCPIRGVTMCGSLAKCDYEKMIPIVEQWSKDHPIKTRQSEFLKVFPNAMVDAGVLSIAPCRVDTKNYRVEKCDGLCVKCCHKYWSQEVE